jgi:microcystin-dependent protein
VSGSEPSDPVTGEQWYDSTNGQLKIWTGGAWRLIGPLSVLATGNSGVIPDTQTDSPFTTTYIILKFFIDNVLVAVWSKDGPFNTTLPGFLTIQKGLNLHATLGHTFWGNSEVASKLYVNNVAFNGNAFVRNDISATINGSLTLTNDSGITLGAASDFVASVNTGVVTLRNQTNNRDLILSVRSGGVQTPFIRGNSVSGSAEVYSQPSGSSSPLTVATKNYVDILSGSVNGITNFFGHVTPNSNVTSTLGNTTNRWSNIFSESILVGNVNAANTFATISNVAQIYLGADIIPTANNSSNIGSNGVFLRTVHAQNILLSGVLTAGGNINASNFISAGSSQVATNLSVGGLVNIPNNTISTSTTTGALTVGGGAGVAGNLHVGGTIITATLPSGTANTAVATTAFVQTVALPSGSLMMWPAAAAPTGWLLCNGSAVSRTAYAALFAIIGTTYGIGDGSTTFNLPNYTNRVPVGAAGLYALGVTGGSKDATVVSHTHTASTAINETPHSHNFTRYNLTNINTGGFGSDSVRAGSQTDTTSSQSTGITATTTVASAGSSGTDANMQPYLAINFIIKT